jgi:tRNA pseudouridine38-40 synthase
VPAVADAAAAAPTRWRLTVAYDGGRFRGFAEQPGLPTVAGALSAALARATRAPEPPRLTCAGRTDAGVHARGQVVSVDLAPVLPAVRDGRQLRPMGPADLVRRLNRQLAPAIVVRDAAPAAPDFDARRSATARRYRYLVWNGPVPDPLLAPLSWHVATPLELRAMATASDPLVGEHDFGAFCRRPPGAAPGTALVRRVIEARWWAAPGPEGTAPGHLLGFEIEASSFCHQMVRSLVATLVRVGSGRANAASVVALLRRAERAGGPEPAPPEGLCLMAVRYDATPEPPEAHLEGTDGLPVGVPEPMLVRRPAGWSPGSGWP